MSIFFDFDVGPSGRRFRRAVDDDKNDIELILDRHHSEQLFGVVDIGKFIELSTLSICMLNKSKDVVGFMALRDHPNVPGVDPGDWETWIRNMFQRFYLARNTLFIHFMCCKDSVLEYFMEEACISVFLNDVYLLNIVLLTDSKCSHEHVARYLILKKRTMYRYCARRSDDSETVPHYMHVALRQDYCPKLKIRRAVEEDNDDIVKILDKKCPRVKDMYGSYYISELLGRHPESNRKIIVPEHQGRAVGVMCLNPEINYKKLQDLYNLYPYHGLMKATPLEKEQLKRSNSLLSTFGEPIMLGKFSPFDTVSTREDYAPRESCHSKEPTPRESTSSKKQKVNFKHPSLKELTLEKVVIHVSDDYSERVFLTSPSPSQLSYKSFEDLFLDEDPFDYEIVNIDKSLLSLGEAFSDQFLRPDTKVSSEQSSILSLTTEPQLCKRKKRQSIHTTSYSKDTLQEFCGEPNAFIVELFGLHYSIDERRSIDLLEAAFEIMKDFDYCVIRVPAADRTFALLQHFVFVPVQAKRCSQYSLYIAHRSSVLGKLRVRKAECMDAPFVARFLQNVEGPETISTIEHGFLDHESYQAYVFMSGLSVIGLGILEPPEQLKFIRSKYNVDPYHNHKHHLSEQGAQRGFAAIKVILTYPVFEVHHRFFAREMMRLSGSSSLIWITGYRNKVVAHKSNSLVSAMIPLLPRLFELDHTKVPELNKIASMSRGMLPFSTWFLDKKLTSVPFYNISTRIVILGASRTTMAFLNALLFGPSSTYLIFNNVTLISTNGWPYMRHTSTAAEMMFPKHQNTSQKYLKSIPYTYYVNTISGTVVEINKQDKHVTLSNGSKYNYDLLFLFFGKQYQHPEYLKPLTEQSMKCTVNSPYVHLDIPNKYIEPDYINYNTPTNVFIINHVVQASNALKYVNNLLTEGYDFKVIVYGATIHAYCCLTALMELNVPTENIIFVDPFPPENPHKARVSVFYNSNVDETVSKVLKSLKVEVYRSYYFQSWTTYDNTVTHVEFLSQLRMIKLECSAFFYYGRRGINSEAFLSLNKSGMAYDGGILIDHQFRTRDPSIYAAGPATAYYRRYFGQNKKQKYYDSYEVGNKLGSQIRNLLDPVFTEKKELKRTTVTFSTVNLGGIPSSGTSISTANSSSSIQSSSLYSSELNSSIDDQKLPNFMKPKVKYCKLPGGLQYLEVRAPGKKVPHYYVQSLSYRGVVMETFKSGYFKIHLTPDLVVDGITCLTYEKYNLENFRNLYGYSTTVLNHVHLRYTTKKLDNFYEFFRSPWAHFLYHDQVDELFAMVKELLPKDSKGKADTFTEALLAVTASEGLNTDTMKKLKTLKKFEASPYIEAVTDYVIEWLSQNDVLLPMYLQPSDKMAFAHDSGRYPIFRKKRTSIAKLMRKIF